MPRGLRHRRRLPSYRRVAAAGRQARRRDGKLCAQEVRQQSSRTAGGGIRCERKILRMVPAPIRCPRRRSSGARPDAGQVTAPGGGLDARYEELRHAALHARAQAFPLGLGVLTGRGVTAWQRALASLAAPQPAPPGAAPAHPAALRAPVAPELISALAAVALAGRPADPAAPAGLAETHRRLPVRIRTIWPAAARCPYGVGGQRGHAVGDGGFGDQQVAAAAGWGARR